MILLHMSKKRKRGRNPTNQRKPSQRKTLMLEAPQGRPRLPMAMEPLNVPKSPKRWLSPRMTVKLRRMRRMRLKMTQTLGPARRAPRRPQLREIRLLRRPHRRRKRNGIGMTMQMKVSLFSLFFSLWFCGPGGSVEWIVGSL